MDVPDWDDLDDLTDEEREALEEKAIAGATASRTPEELETEIAVLDRLLVKSAAVKASPTYAKWDSLRDTLDDADEMRDDTGARRKVIIFTEHKDTLDDLVDATHAAPWAGRRRGHHPRRHQARGPQEGQGDVRAGRARACSWSRRMPPVKASTCKNAHLVINYDLPWNPNRIEQRFGRVHRIGQPNVCHMWSLVAKDTREGDVYGRLLEKLEEQRAALGGRVYDVLGQLFEGNALRDLMIAAIREANAPERQRYLIEVIDPKISEGIPESARGQPVGAVAARRLKSTRFALEMERAEAARLQPHHVEAFFHKAFADVGGSLRIREGHRFEVRRVPGEIKERDRVTGYGQPVVDVLSPRHLRPEVRQGGRQQPPRDTPSSWSPADGRNDERYRRPSSRRTPPRRDPCRSFRREHDAVCGLPS